MSAPDTKDDTPQTPLQIDLPEGLPAVIKRGAMVLEFSQTALRVNGTLYTVANAAFDRPPAAPAILRHTLTSGRYGLNTSDIGQMIESDTVCEGILLAPAFQYVDTDENVIDRKFDVFTTAYDTRHLTRDKNGECGNYMGDIQRIAALDHYGHTGILMPDDQMIYESARHYPQLLSRWHMPVVRLVGGSELGVQPDRNFNPNNMRDLQRSGALQEFQTCSDEDRGYFYWTATKHDKSGERMRVVNFAYALSDPSYNYLATPVLNKFSSRPVRAVERAVSPDKILVPTVG